MKKVIPTIVIVAIFTLVFMFCFRSCVSATNSASGELIEENEGTDNQEVTPKEGTEQSKTEEFNLKLYIQERIVPVVVGVITAIAGLLSTIMSIKKSVRSLTNLKNSFSEEKAQREASLADNKKLLQDEVSRLQAQTKDLPEMKETIDQLREQIGTMGQMLQLAYSADANLVKTGKSKKMALLVEKIRVTNGGDSNDEAKA